MAVDVKPGRPPLPATALEAPSPVAPPSSPWPRRLLWLGAIVAAIAAGLAWFPPGFPNRWVVDAGALFQDVESWVIENDDTFWLFVYVIEPLRSFTNQAFDAIVDLLLRLTWIGAITLFASIAGLVAGWKMALFTAGGFFLMGALGLWEESIETLALVVMMVLGAIIIALVLIWVVYRTLGG